MKYILEEPGILRKYFQSNYTRTKKFRHILVDEAQDLPGDWLELLGELLNKKDKSNMWIFEDPFQVSAIDNDKVISKTSIYVVIFN